MSIYDATDPGYNRDFTYDDLSRLVTANSGASLWGAGSYAYDAMGNLTSRSLGTAPVDDGTVLSVPGRHLRAKNAVTGVVDQLAFTYNSTTPQIAVATQNGTDHTVSYDAAGNETSYFVTRTYSPRNLLATVTDNSGEGTPHTISYGYDARGVRVTRTESPTNSGAANRYFTYSPELQLLSITDDDSPNVWASGHASISSAPIAPSHYFYYFNGMPVAEWGPPRTADSTVDLSLRRHAPFAVGTANYFTFTDHLGTPLLQTDTSGNVVWRAEHEPYGNVWKMRSGARTDQPLRLPGQDLAMTWEGTEENYNVFRWYRAGWGRYTQADPLGLMAGADLFAYASNPLIGADSLGLYRIDDQTLRNPIASLSITSICKTSPVACTMGLGAAISYECVGCSGNWHAANVTLYIRGQVYAFSGNPNTLGVKIVDKSVHDFASAVKHEHAWHINIAAAAVDSIITAFEGKHFDSEMECQDAGAWANGDVQSRFSYVFHETQMIENRGGDPTKVPFH